MSKDIFKKHRINIKWLVSYLCVFLIVAVLIGCTYFQAQNIAKKNIEKYTLGTLVNIQELVDSKIHRVNLDMIKIGTHYQTQQILSITNPIEHSRLYDFSEFITFINTIHVPDSVYADFLVYAHSNQYILSGVNRAMNINTYYKVSYPSQSAGSYDEWFSSRILNISKNTFYPLETIFLNGKTKQVIPYITSLPFESNKNYSGTMIALLDFDMLFDDFSDTALPGNRFVLDSNNNLIAGLNGNADFMNEISLPANESGFYMQKLGGENMIVVYARSELAGLTIIEVTPYKFVMNQVSQLKILFVAAIFVCLILCAAIAGFFIRRNVTPITALHSLLCETLGNEHEYKSDAEYINASVQTILTRNKTMESSLEQQMSQIQASYLSRLLIAGLEDDEMTAALSHINLHYGKKYCVIILKLGASEPSEAYLRKLTIRSHLEQYTSRLEMVDVGVNRLAVVLSFQEDSDDICMSFADEIILKLKNDLSSLHIYLNAFGGTMCESLTQLPYSFWEADQISQKSIYASNIPVHWHQRRFTGKEPIFFYPLEVEQLMLTNVRSGNFTEIEKTFKKIIMKNFYHPKISSSIEQLLVSRLKATLLMAIDEVYTTASQRIDVMKSVIRLPEPIPIEQFEDLYLEIMEKLCKETQRKQLESNKKLRKTIMQFVDKNCMNPDMSLTLAASEFQMSESYFSTYFREETGENFGTYIERKRLEQACLYLKEKAKTVEEIALIVGYTSAHSFRRAFKRRYGVPPASYSVTAEKIRQG